MSQEWKRSIFLTLPKKGDLRLCSNYRTIALIPHASKILLKIIQDRLATHIEREMAEEQAMQSDTKYTNGSWWYKDW